MKLIRPITITDSILAASNVTEAYPVHAAGSYAEGAIVVDPTGHKLFKSLVPSNTAPLTNGENWLEIGPSNRWAMFDQKTGTQSTRAESITVDIAVSGRADSLALLNITAANVTISVLDGGVEVWTDDVSLTSSTGITGWYAWLFEPIQRQTDRVLTNLPNVLNPTIRVTLTGGGTVAIGGLIVGSARKIGDTEWGAKVGITDYSRVEADEFGNYAIVKRDYNKRGDYTVWVARIDTDFVFNLLAQYRATPVVVVAASAYSSTFMFGLLKDWSIALSYPQHSILSLEFQGI